MPTKPKKKPAAKRRTAPKKKAAKPKFNLALTDRMKAQGYTGRWRYLRGRCQVCGGWLATNGDSSWCVGVNSRFEPVHLEG